MKKNFIILVPIVLIANVAISDDSLISNNLHESFYESISNLKISNSLCKSGARSSNSTVKQCIREAKPILRSCTKEKRAVLEAASAQRTLTKHDYTQHRESVRTCLEERYAELESKVGS